MSWTWPPAWGVGHLVLASELNTFLRDNLLALGVAQVAAEGDLIVGAAANEVDRLAVGDTDDLLFVESGVPTWAALTAQNPYSGTATLTDVTANATGWNQWGTEEAVVSDPEAEVTILAWLHGQSTGAVVGPDNQFLRLSISTDGGSNWTTGPEVAISHASSYNYSVGVFFALEKVSTTGDIQVKAEYYEDDANELDLTDGVISVLVVEDS